MDSSNFISSEHQRPNTYYANPLNLVKFFISLKHRL